MTTKIKSIYSNKVLYLSAHGSDSDSANLAIVGEDIGVRRADLLDAIRTELNVIVIDKTELPEVTVEGNEISVDGFTFDTQIWSAEDARRVLNRYAALAAYLEADPPIPEDVRTLMHLIRNAPNARVNGARALAEDLLATGRIDIKEPS